MATRLSLSLASLLESGYLLSRMAAPDADGRMPAVTARAIAVLAAEGPMGVTALSRRCHVSQPTMTDGVRRATAARWMRAVGPGARPRYEATHAGIAVRRAQREADGAVLEPRFARLGARERATLERAAMILASGLERDGD